MFCQQPAASSKYKRREWEEISNYNRASDVRCGIVWREKYTRVRLLDAFLAMHWMFVCGSLFSSSLSIALHFITHNGQHFDTTSYHFVCKATTVRWCILWILAYNMDFFSALLSGAILWVFFGYPSSMHAMAQSLYMPVIRFSAWWVYVWLERVDEIKWIYRLFYKTIRRRRTKMRMHTQ